MLNRYQGENGRSFLIDALRNQNLLRDEEILSLKFVDKVSLLTLETNEILISQDGTDNDIYFVLSGRFSITVKGREVAIRKPGDSIGEMALIDVLVKRSASVIAIEPSVVAKVTASAFTEIASQHPQLWKRIALELSNRLRQRNDYVRQRNPRPVLFIGSSSESLSIARAIQSCLQYDDFIVKVWTDQVFGASRFPIEDLEVEIINSDFAALVLSPDDKLISRAYEHLAPRDNVVFELGMCMGALTRYRTFLVSPRGMAVKTPTDLEGLNHLNYVPCKDDELATYIAPLCSELRRIIKKLGTK